MIRLSIQLFIFIFLVSCSPPIENETVNNELKMKENLDSKDSLYLQVEAFKKEIEKIPNSPRRKKLEEKVKMMIEVLKVIDERDSVLRLNMPDSIKFQKTLDSISTKK